MSTNQETAVLSNPLLDGNLLPRQSFHRFAENCKRVAEKYGRTMLLLTFAGNGAHEEQINVEELEKPRTGLYRARIEGDDRVAEAEFVATSDEPARNGRNFIDRSYQELLETIELKYKITAQENLDLVTRLDQERKLRLAAEDETRVLQRRVEELEAEVEEADEKILDDSMIAMISELFGDFTGSLERSDAARVALDTIEAHPEVARVLEEHVPQVILLLAHAAGESTDDDTPEAP